MNLPEIDEGQARAFLGILHGQPAEGSEYVITTIMNGNADNLREPSGSIADVTDQALYSNVYATVNQFREDTQGRKQDDVIRVMGLAMDLDVKAEALYKKSGELKQDWPHDEAEMAVVLAAIEAEAPMTMTVGSGSGGLHGYWLFDQASDQPEQAKELGERFRLWINRVAGAALGRPIVFDSVMNLDRVFRVPGTIRHPKPDEVCGPAPVVLLKNDGPRYRAEDLRDLSAPEETPETPSAEGPSSLSAIVRATVAPPEVDSPRVAAWIRTVVGNIVGEYAAIRQTGMNTGLNDAAITLGGLAGYGYTNRDEIHDLLIEASKENGLLSPSGRDGHNSRSQVEATFKSGWEAGLRKPYALPEWMAEVKEPIDVSSQSRAATWLREELGRGELSGLFVRDGMIVHTPRVGEDGYRPPTEQETANRIDLGPAQVRPVDIDGIKALVENQYDIGKRSGSGDAVTWTGALFPRASAASAVNAAQLGVGAPNLCQLTGVTHTPAMRRDGTVLDSPGFDRATGLLYLPDNGAVVPAVPEDPTDAEIKAAVEFLLKPVAQFPFVTETHRANWLGLMMTPVLRALLPPPYQFGICTATNPGSGKTLLMSLITEVHGGVMRGEMPRDKEEMRKTLMATLISTTAPVVLFDNVRGVIRSGELENLLTARTLSDRVLGQSLSVTATNDRLWLATGNNVQIGGDLARRCIMIELDPKCANPHLRTGFKLDPARWIHENRGEYLGALLTVARGWMLAGAPVEGDRSDSFANWVASIRGMLTWAGVPGSFGSSDDGLSAVSEEDAEWAGFCEELHRVFGGEAFEAKDILAALTSKTVGDPGFFQGDPEPTAGIDPHTLPEDLGDKFEAVRQGSGVGFTKSVGRWLKNRDGRYADGWKITRKPIAGRAAQYIVHPPQASQQ